MKIVDISETTAACVLKLSRYRQLTGFMKVYGFCRSMSFLVLGPMSFTYES